MIKNIEVLIDTARPWNIGLSFGAAAAKIAREHDAAGFVIEGLLETAARLHAEYYPGEHDFDDIADRFASGAESTIEHVLQEKNPEWDPDDRHQQAGG